jgi:hypothetical protein
MKNGKIDELHSSENKSLKYWVKGKALSEDNFGF